MSIEFRENPLVRGNIQVYKDDQHKASIDAYCNHITFITFCTFSFDDIKFILSKMKELQSEVKK